MDKYYYLASTLATPVFGQEPPISSGELRDLCSRLLGEAERGKLEAVSVLPPEGEEAKPAFAFQEKFWRRERALRTELARQRAEKLARKAEGTERETEAWDAEAQVSARRALAAADPLQAELSLERDRWEWIDAEASGHAWDEDALCAYALKILILERLSRFTEEAGAERYDSMYRTILSGSERLAARGGESRTGNGE